MEIRGERDKKKVRFDSLKVGEPFYYNGELCMKISEITNNSGFYGVPAYNCVSLCYGRIMSFSDDAMVGIAGFISKRSTNGQRTLLSNEDDQQSAWSVRVRKREVRMVATVGQLLFRLVDCNRAGQNRNEDEEVRA